MNIHLGRSFDEFYPDFEGQDRNDPNENSSPSRQDLLNILSLLQHKIIQLQTLLQTMEKPDHSMIVAWSMQFIVSELVSACVVMLPASQQQTLNMLGVNGLSDDHLILEKEHGGQSNSIECNNFNSCEGCSGSGSTQNITLQSHKAASSVTNDGKVPGVTNNGKTTLGDISVSQEIRDDPSLKNANEESLPTRSYKLIEVKANEILAEHTHFCEMCNKGFKRDTNLRMHMRAHGDEYKTQAALA